MSFRALTTFLTNCVSRSKTILKRRKIMVKKRSISKKSLVEERKVMNYAHEMKILSIQKELDRKKHENSHLHEIMNELFYPDVRLSNEEALQLAVQQQSYTPASGQEFDVQDQILQEIHQAQLATELIDVYTLHSEEFQIQHFSMLFDRINSYLYRLDRIKQRRMYTWNKMVAKTKKTDAEKQKKKCPFVFLDKDDLQVYEPWRLLIRNLQQKLSSMALQEMNEYLLIINRLQRRMLVTSAQMFRTVISRNLSSPTDLLYHHKVGILQFMLQMNIGAGQLAEYGRDATKSLQKSSLENFGKKLCWEVLSSPKLTRPEFLMIIGNRHLNFTLFSQESLDRVVELLKLDMTSFSPEIVIQFLQIYRRTARNSSIQVLELLKFDIYRKIDFITSEKLFLSLLSIIEDRNISLKQTSLAVPAFDLLQHSTIMASKFIASKLYASHQLHTIISIYFKNGLADPALAEIISAEVLRQNDKFSLEEISLLMLQVTLMGHRSKMLGKFMFNRFQKSYAATMKHYAQNPLLSLPKDGKAAEGAKNSTGKSQKQIVLQESLIIALWLMISHMGATEEMLLANLQKEIELQQILEMMPRNVDSKEILIKELVHGINQRLKCFKMFPYIAISHSKLPDKTHDRLQVFYKRQFLRTPIQVIMEAEAVQSGRFVNNFNRFDFKFLRKPWSQHAVYDQKDFIKWLKTKPTCNYFNPAVQSSIQNQIKREMALEALEKKEKMNEKTPSVEKPKLYEFVN